MARDELLWVRTGRAQDEFGKSGRGALSNRYIEIRYAPPGLSDAPALLVDYAPDGVSGAEAPAVHVVVSEKADGSAIQIDRSGTGNLMLGMVDGEEKYHVNSTGDGYFAHLVQNDPDADCGAIFWKDASGYHVPLPADYGSGYNFLRSQGECLPPEWVDIQELIKEITGGENVFFAFTNPTPLPSVSIGTAVDSDPGDNSEDISFSVVLPSVSISTAVDSDPGDNSEDISFSVPIPSVSISTTVIP